MARTAGPSKPPLIKLANRDMNQALCPSEHCMLITKKNQFKKSWWVRSISKVCCKADQLKKA